MLAVVAVLSDKLLALAASFADEVAEGVVVIVPVALDHQAVGRDDVRAGAVLHQQVAGRVVGEAFLHVLGVVGAGQAGEGVVVVKVLAFTGVEQAGEVAAFVVVVLATWLQKSNAPAQVKRYVGEGLDDLNRALAAQDFDARQ